MSARIKPPAMKRYKAVLFDADDTLWHGPLVHQSTGALAVAWEGAGGARAAAFSEVPFLEVRGISDRADGEAGEVWMENLPLAMRSVAVVLDALVPIIMDGRQDSGIAAER